MRSKDNNTTGPPNNEKQSKRLFKSKKETPTQAAKKFESNLPEVAKRNNIEGEINLPLEVVEKFNNSLVFPTYDEPIVFIKVINELGNIVDETTKL